MSDLTVQGLNTSCTSVQIPCRLLQSVLMKMVKGDTPGVLRKRWLSTTHHNTLCLQGVYPGVYQRGCQRGYQGAYQTLTAGIT